VRAAAREAVWRILKADHPSDREMARRLESLEREHRQLREDLEELKQGEHRESQAAERR
jgi:hypothetical protein